MAIGLAASDDVGSDSGAALAPGTPLPRVAAASAAYVIYTSGSTGRPKGVVVSHGALANRLEYARRVDFSADDAFLQKTTLAFDVSVLEIFGPLVAGGRVVQAIPGGQQDPAYLVSLMASAAITQASFPPALLDAVLGEPGFAAVARLRTVITGGETVPAELAPRFHAASSADLLNRYGPTEATISMTSWRCRRGLDERMLPIGRPTARARVELLDRRWRPVPPGVVGELCIGGPGLARGYLGRPATTAAVFVPDAGSSEAGARLYRSGDLARWRADGALGFVGRRDRQVKVRGFRVELGEIEAALRRVPGVSEAAVIDVADGSTRRLAGYWVAADLQSPSAAPTSDAVRRALAAALPEYMVPASLQPLDALPRSTTGKIDRKALPAPVWGSAESSGRAPSGELEELLAALFAEVLDRSWVGAEEDFFELGGHSLLATKLASRIRERLGAELPLRQIFEAPTVAGLARQLERAQHGTRPESVAMRRGEVVPASFAQRRLWFVEQLETGASPFHIPVAFHLRGPLSIPALAAALSALVARHEALRTVLGLAGEGLVQIIRPPCGEAPPLLDQALVAGDGRDPVRDEMRRLLVEASRRPFDLARGPLYRFLLLRLRLSEHTLLATFHHAIFDGGSMAILLRELGEAYDAHRGGRAPAWTPLPVQYADFALWQARRLRGALLDEQVAYWRRRLDGAPQSLELPLDRPRPSIQDSAGRTLPVRFDGPLVPGLEKLARSCRATLFMTLLVAFAALLARHGGQRDLVLGTPVGGRTRQRFEGVVGFFVNALPLRLNLPRGSGLRLLVESARGSLLEDFAHQDLPFERMVEELHPERDLSRDPVFQGLFSLHNPERTGLRMTGLEVEVEPVPSASARLDLSLVLRSHGDGLAGSVEYRTGLFDATTIERLLGQLQRLLMAAVEDPDAPFESLELLGAGERHQLLIEWSRPISARRLPAGRLPTGLPAHELVLLRASAEPEARALAQGDESWTFAQLARRSHRLARRLAQLGAGRGELVAVLVERSPREVALLLAILQTGAAYLPLDPDWPQDRLAFVLEDAGARLLVSSRSAAPTVPAVPGVAHFELESLWADASALEATPLGRTVDPRELVYVIYTSGSTGRPKGVQVPHGGLSNLLAWHAGAFPAAPGERATRLLGLAFDVSAWDLWGSLVIGACVMIPESEEIRRSPPQLQRWLVESRVTSCFVATAMGEALLALPWPRDAALRRLHVAGDRLVRRPAADQVFELYNHYGPTEATVLASGQRVRPRDSAMRGAPGIGRALDGVFLAVVDGRGAPVPPGVPGELMIGGAGLARGYLRRPALTAERFVPDDLSAEAGSRLYRSGDVVRWRADSSIDFLGRRDDQIQLRGYRVELGEVESALASHPAVREAAVVAVPGPAGLWLAAFAVVEERPLKNAPAEGERLRAELTSHLAQQLPGYMLPAALDVVGALPWTANGKVDRKALAAQALGNAARASRSGRPLRGTTEQHLARLFQELLGVEVTTAEADFFALGGHSLLAVQLASRIREGLGVEVPLRRFLETPSLAGLASFIDAAAPRSHREARPLLRHEGPVPASFAQRRLWFVEQLRPGTSTFHIPLAVQLRGALDVPALAAALGAVIARHEALRTALPLVDGEPAQQVRPARPVVPPLLDLEGLGASAAAAEAWQRLLEEARRPFDLARGPLCRFLLLRQSEAEHKLLATFHHAIFDGWSMGVLWRDLGQAYDAHRAGAAPAWEPLPAQYADFTLWQWDRLRGELLEQQLAYWRRRLDGVPRGLELPTDRPRPLVQDVRGRTLPLSLGADLTAGLETLARGARATLFMTLAVGFAMLLARHSGQRDLVLGTPVAGRDRQRFEGLVGFFVNALPLRLTLPPGAGFRALVEACREAVLEDFAHQDLPFERLVEELHPERDLSRDPFFQAMFSLHNPTHEGLRLAGLEVKPLPVPSVAARLDLSLVLRPRGGGLEGSVEYRTALFDATTMGRLVEQLGRLLAGAVARPEAPFERLDLLGAGERHQLTAEWSRTVAAGRLPAGVPVHELVHRRAELEPAAPALEHGEVVWSYGELSRRAHRLARRLVQLGAGRGALVGVLIERSPLEVALLLAILETGAAFLPFDPEWPEARTAFVLEDSGLRLLVVSAALKPLVPSQPRVICLELETLWAEAAVLESSPSIGPAVDPQEVAYVIYTSGSTGWPKGAELTHGGFANLIGWHTATFPAGPGERTTRLSGPAFDASVWELWPTLVAGGCACSPGEEETRRSPPELQRWLIDRGITSCFVATPMAEALLALGWPRDLALRRLHTAGDRLLRRPAPELGFEVFNHYGPTENTVQASWQAVSPADPEVAAAPGIGRAIDGVFLAVVDGAGVAVPAGVGGELLLGGSGLARGYLRRPALTAERFVPDALSGSAGGRLYRTGDLVRWRADGRLDFLGRGDDQVQVRGFRVELGEVESALASHPAVREAAVVAVSGPAGLRLAAFAAVSLDAAASPAVLQAHLAGMLPGYMLPSTLEVLESLPWTANGKLDRRALVARARSAATGVAHRGRPLRGTTEKLLARLFAELLGVEVATAEADFFALGGHSLLAVRLAARIEEALGVEVPLATLLSSTTVEALAARIQAGTPRSRTPLVVLAEGAGSDPLFLVHPVGGTVLCYRELARGLAAGGPVYGFEAPGIDGREKPLSRIEAMAERYLEVAKAQRDGGPWRLGGWSLGGVVAYEMACRLRRDGQAVAPLLLFDSWLPAAGDEASAIGADGGEDLLPAFVRHLGLEPSRVEQVRGLLTGQSGSDPETDLGLELVDGARLGALFAAFESHARALRRYRPQPYDGPVLLFEAQRRPAGAAGRAADGWRPWIGDGLAVETVPGDHFTMLEGEAGRRLAERLLGSLAGAGEAS